MKRSNREFLWASLACGAWLCWIFGGPIMNGRNAFIPPAADAVRSVGEPQYSAVSADYVLSRMVRRGIFPAWTPYSQAGTPLIGKMAPGVFSPFNLLKYVLPERWLPVMILASAALKLYFAFAFLYLFERLLGLGWRASVAGALCFVSTHTVRSFVLFGLTGTIACLPLLFLLAELFLRGRRRTALLLLPWASAFSFLGAHFETAALANLSASIYFLARLWGEPALPSGQKPRRLLAFAGALLGGACIAGFNILAVVEYVGLSYTKVWRTLDSYGWHYLVISKHLSADDVPLMAGGLAAAAAFVFLFVRLPRVLREGGTAKRLLHLGAAAAVLAAALAMLANLGMDLSLAGLHMHSGEEPVFVIADLLLFFIAFWAWSETESAPLRILGWMMLSVLLIRMKTPPLTNIMVLLPFFKDFNNRDYHYVCDAAAGVLFAAGLDRIFSEISNPSARRPRSSALACLGVLLAGYAAASPLEGLAARIFTTGIVHPPAAGQPPGGVMGVEKIQTGRGYRTLSGWIPAEPTPASILAGRLENGGLADGTEARRAPDGSGRLYFNADVALPKPGESQLGVAVRFPGGGSRFLAGPSVTSLPSAAVLESKLALALFFLAVALLLWLPPPALAAVCLLTLGAWLWPGRLAATPADTELYRFPTLEALRRDPEPFRVATFDPNFLHADFLSIYGLSDVRTGGDNLDLYSMTLFSRLAYYFLSSAGKDPRAFDLGLSLFGLADVRYFLGPPGLKHDAPGLEPLAQGADVTVWRNRRALPRAAFFERAATLPVDFGKIWDHTGEGGAQRVLGAVAGALSRGELDPAKTLLLNDPPASAPPAPSAARPPADSSARIVEDAPDRVLISVDAAVPGFVFLGDSDYPGWKAVLNGRQAPILRSWLTFRAVQVPAGRSTLEFRYSPGFMGLPLVLSVLSCVAWLALVFRRRGVAPPPPPVPIRQKKKGVEKAAALPTALESARTEECGRIGESLALGLVGATLLFWTFWSGFVYRGAFVNWTARALALAVLAAAVVRGLKSPAAEAK
jgi:hypothetical protein